MMKRRTGPNLLPQRSKRRCSGRPTKRTPEIVEVILQNLRKGDWLARASRGAGVHPKTTQRWLRHFPDFREAVTEARIEGRPRAALVAWLNHPFRGRRPPRSKRQQTAPYPVPSYHIPRSWRHTSYRGGPAK